MSFKSSLPPWSDRRLQNNNNIDFMRLLFSGAVIFSHAFDLLLGEVASDPLGRISNGFYTFGGVAVSGFFILSGFLISISLMRSKSLSSYLNRRIRRIYPGFIVAVLLTAVLGYLFQLYYVPPEALWREGGRMVIKTLTLTSWEPPLAFPENPFHTFNGSLWTIRPEFTCYLLLIVVMMFKKGRAQLVMLAVLPLLLWLVSVACRFAAHPLLLKVVPYIPASGTPGWPPRLWLCFAAGVAMNLYGYLIPYRHSLVAVSAAALVLLNFTPLPKLARIISIIPLAYILFWFAYHPGINLHEFGRHGDFSYGIYLYGFPVEQVLVQWMGPSLNPYTLTLLALAVLMPIAALSWYWVERPCLPSSRKHRYDTAAPTSPG